MLEVIISIMVIGASVSIFLVTLPFTLALLSRLLNIGTAILCTLVAPVTFIQGTANLADLKKAWKWALFQK